MSLPLELITTLLLLSVLSALLYFFLAPRYTSLPPGPPRTFFGFGGNKIPPYNWRYFDGLTKEYGPVCTVWLGRTPLVVVGGYAAAMELLEKKAGVTADRPRSVLAGEYLSGGKRILLVGHGERWKRLRKMLHQGLQPSKAASYESIQEAAVRTMLLDTLNKPDDFQEHAKKYAASVIMSITYGKTTPTQYSDLEVVAVNVCGERLGRAARPGAYAVDSYPVLDYFPGKWKTQSQAWHKEELELFSGQMEVVRKNVKTGQGVECFGRYMIDHQDEYHLSNDEIAYLGGSMFGAGSDTTASAITVAVMAGVLYPDAVKVAQAEIDRVVGHSRLPSMSDLEDLIYVQAYIREVFRWRPVSAGGFRHQTMEPITYGNYVIPAGTAIVGNHWAICRDPDVFTEPDLFRPERWIVQEGHKEFIRKDLYHHGYGFGRRVCPGRNVADRSTFLTISGLLWGFDFAKKFDAQGKEVEIDTLAFTDTANSHPKPFQAALTPRFADVQKVLGELEST